MELNYASYLELGTLLELQHPRSDPVEHDELLFIVMHQTAELWFKELLHELDASKAQLSENKLAMARATFHRVRTVMKTLVQQTDILETMTPLSFSLFRERLETSSGFQSMQFRELEFVLGLKRREVLEHYPPDLPGRAAAEARLAERSVPDHFYDFLECNGVAIPERIRARDVTLPHIPDDEVQEGILRLYRAEDPSRVLFEVMTDLDEGLQEWRYRHVKMVERTIGNKPGTGGSLGVEFLKRTLFQPVFPDLWQIRHRF